MVKRHYAQVNWQLTKFHPSAYTQKLLVFQCKSLLSVVSQTSSHKYVFHVVSLEEAVGVLLMGYYELNPETSQQQPIPHIHSMMQGSVWALAIQVDAREPTRQHRCQDTPPYRPYEQ